MATNASANSSYGVQQTVKLKPRTKQVQQKANHEWQYGNDHEALIFSPLLTYSAEELKRKAFDNVFLNREYIVLADG